MRIIHELSKKINRGPGLAEELRAYAGSGIYPMHMPGHKRNPAFMDAVPAYCMDVTEAEGLDDLHAPEGILMRGMDRAAELYGSGRAFYLVNGSTCGILAGMRACARRGDAAVIARNNHRSAYHALELCGIVPAYVMPEYDAETGIAGSISPGRVREALESRPGARLVVITSPTYEGVLSDIRSIADEAHKAGALLLVDEAHGAHLGFSPAFPAGAVRSGADIVVQSLHKTLPALNQAALLHVCGSRADSDGVARQLSVFETSSPSYPVMASIDSCVALVRERGAALFAAYAERLDMFYGRMAALRRLRVPGPGNCWPSGAFFARDPGKVIILSGSSGYTGMEILRLLRDRGVALEMAAGGYALAMSSICDTDEGFGRLAEALLSIDAAAADTGPPAAQAPPEAPIPVMGLEDALQGERELVPLGESQGCVSAGYVWLYPPGVPLLAPGELITPGLVLRIQALARQGMCPASTYGGLPQGIMAVRQAGRRV